jgi:hypothetical protein
MKRFIFLAMCSLLLAGCSAGDPGLSVTGLGASSSTTSDLGFKAAGLPTIPPIDAMDLPTFAAMPTMPSIQMGSAPTMDTGDTSGGDSTTSSITYPNIPDFSLPDYIPQPAATKKVTPASSASQQTDQSATHPNQTATSAAGSKNAPAQASKSIIKVKTPVPTVIVGAETKLGTLELPGAPSLAIVEQPDGQPNFVSTSPDTVTHFAIAQTYGVTGLLAHNTLAGVYFATLKKGDTFDLVDNTGQRLTYQVETIRSYQALSPGSTSSSFVDLADGQNYTASQLFGLVYTGTNQVTLQTCIEKDGDASWGRLFVIAKKV